MRGAKPKPIDQIKAEGGYRPHRHAPRDLAPLEDDVPPPVDFDKEHAALWSRFVEDMKPLGLPQKQHLHSLELLCRLMVDRRKLDKQIQKDGYTYTKTDKDGDPVIKQNPAVTLRKQIDDQVIRIFDTFGFNPRSSMAMKIVPPKEKKTSLVDLMKGGAYAKN